MKVGKRRIRWDVAIQYPDDAVAAVHFHHLPILEQTGRVMHAGNTGNTIFPRHDCSVLQSAANF